MRPNTTSSPVVSCSRGDTQVGLQRPGPGGLRSYERDDAPSYVPQSIKLSPDSDVIEVDSTYLVTTRENRFAGRDDHEFTTSRRRFTHRSTFAGGSDRVRSELRGAAALTVHSFETERTGPSKLAVIYKRRSTVRWFGITNPPTVSVGGRAAKPPFLAHKSWN